jgi:FkbM family methyltransferase
MNLKSKSNQLEYMKVRFITFRYLLFYFSTRSPFYSKIKVFIWFVVRLLFRVFFGVEGARKIMKRMEKEIVKTKMHDNVIFLNTIEQIVNIHEIYGERKHELLKLDIGKKPVIFDIGAHIGIFSLKYAYKYPNGIVYSIEPERNNFEMLRRNIKLNRLNNVRPLKLALFDKSGYTKLFVDNVESGKHTLIGSGKMWERIKVDMLDNLVRKLNVNSVDLIKIDTEGAEYQILLGGIKTLKKFRPSLIIETHPWKDKNCDKKISRLLKDLSYNFKIFGNKGSIIFAWHRNER